MKIAIFGSNLQCKGVSKDHTQNEKQFFLAEITKQIISFQKLFILSKYYMFWVMNLFLFCAMFFIKKG